MRLLIFICLGLLWSTYSSAQVVNIENKRIYDDTTGLSGALEGTFSAQRTRDLLYTLAFKTLVQYKSKTKKHYYLLLNDLRYSAGDVVYANSGMSHFRYAYRIKNSPWKWESYAQVQYNQLLLQKLRALGGTGIRWKFYDKNNAKFFVGTSFFYEYEEIQPEIEFNNDVRWSNYLSWFIVKPTYSFTAATYYQPNVADFKDFRLSGQYTFLFKLKRKVDFKVEFTNFYDSRPPVTVRNFVFSSTFGFVVRLG